MTQRLNRTSAEDVFLEYALSAFPIDARVPDILWIDDHHWTVAALVHAAGVIDANDALQPMLSRALLQDFMHLLRALGRAGLA